MFAPSQVMSGKEFITFMGRAMGYQVSSLSSGLDTALSSKMLSASQIVSYANISSFTRGQAVDVIYSAVRNGVIFGTEQKLIDKLVQSGAVTTSAGITLGYNASVTTPTPTSSPLGAALSVTGVTIPNCKQVVVTFNREIQAESANTTNFEVKDRGIAVVSATPSLSSDKKTVVLNLDGSSALTNASTATITVRRTIKDTSGAFLGTDYVKSNVDVLDAKRPELVSVRVVGQRTIELKYDEPVWSGTSASISPSHFAVNSGIYTYQVLSAMATPVDSTVLLTIGSVLGSGTIEVRSNILGLTSGSVTDYAGYNSLNKTVSFTYSPDLTTVTAAIESVNRVTKKVIVKFSKPIYGANVRLYQFVSGVDAYGSPSVTKTEANASSTWEFTMTNGIPTGSVSFFLVNSANAVDQMSDLFGQKVPNINLTYTIVADTTPPSVTALYVNGNSSIDVMFSEELDPTEADRIANFEVKNVAGVKKTITDAQLQADQETVRLLVPLTDLETYTIKVLSMKDVAGNVMTAQYTATKTVSDNSNPKVTSAYAVPSERKIYITFSEAMNTSDMSTKSNYLVDRDGGTNNYVVLGDADSVTVTDSRHIVLMLGNAITTPSVKMYAFKDLSGKKLGSDSSFEYTGEGGNLTNIGSETVTLDKAELISRNQVRLTFNTRIVALGSNDFIFRNSSGGGAFTNPILVNGVAGSGENEFGQTMVVVNLSQTLNPDASYTDNGTVKGVEVQVQPIGTYSASTALITARNHSNALPLLDVVGGGIALDGSNQPMIFWNDFNADLKLDTVVVKYDEPILESSLSTVTFTVSGYSIVGVSIDSDGIVSAGTFGDHVAGSRYVILNITKANQTNDAGTKPEVVQQYGITDVQGNIIE